MKRSDFVLTLGQRLMLLLCLFLVCYILTFVCSWLLGRLLAHRLPVALELSALAQDVIAFVVPSVVTAVFVTRRPAVFLCVTKVPHVEVLLLVAAVTFVSIPMQEALIYWNYHISLPVSMAAFEELMRSMEASAADTLRILMGEGSVASLVLNILIIGVAAAFSEELLFRGCFQRLLTTAGVNGHVAVWVVAFCFSALHMQFFGFVPRMLLGAYFGYLLLWTRSIWVPITAHLLNNVLFVVSAFYQIRNGNAAAIDAEPELWAFTPTAISVVLTAVALTAIYLYSKRLGSDADD